MGRTKVFLKYWHIAKLDLQLKRFEAAAIVLQKWGRGFLARVLKRRLQADALAADRVVAEFMAELHGTRAGTHSDGCLGRSDAFHSKQLKSVGKGPPKEALPPLQKRKAPPLPAARTEAELKRDATIAWWKAKEQPRGAGQDYSGTFLPWFHGPIDRKETERLLKPRKVGCFLVRVSENRFGYTLSYRTKDRCKHFMVEQDTRGRYALVGIEKICNSLNELINWFQRNRMNEEGEMLREHGARFPTEMYTQECHWFPHLLA
jgi:hypothetical protein